MKIKWRIYIYMVILKRQKKSKFPSEVKKIYPFHYDPPKIVSEDLAEEVRQILLRMNPKASPGKIGISNKFLLWLIKNDDIYGCVKLIIKLMEKILYFGIPPLISALMMDSHGIIFGKEKNGQFDFDVRPIVVAPSIIRLLDKVIMALHGGERHELIGPFQLMGKKQALEIGKVVMAQAKRFQLKCPDLAFLSLDAWNAYNSGSRNSTHAIVSEVSPRLANWFKFLYHRDNNVAYDCQTSIPMQSGVIQGLASSNVFFHVLNGMYLIK